jgi:hypothetical protein
MTTREQALIMVRKAKSDLRKETDPDRKHKIAIWGEEMGTLSRQLNYQGITEPEAPPKQKRCTVCKKNLLITQFNKLTYYSKKKNLAKVCIRNVCRVCQFRKTKKKSKKFDKDELLTAY